LDDDVIDDGAMLDVEERRGRMQENMKLIVSFLIVFASKAHAYLVVSPSARSMVARRYAEDAEGPTGEPFVDPHETLERGKWEGTVNARLEYLAKGLQEMKNDMSGMRKDMGDKMDRMSDKMDGMRKDISDLKIVSVAIFFVLVLLLVLNCRVEIGDAV
jgi:hypothetical protein